MRTGWVKKKLKDITTKIGSGATPRGGEEAYKTEGISLIRSLNVHDDGFRPAKLARIDDEQADGLSNVVVEANDVMLNITGASVARCCIAPSEFLPARVNQHVSIIRPVKGKLDFAFLHYLLISKIYKDRLLQTGEGGSTRQAITKAQLQEFTIEYPEQISEQQRIVGILDEAFEGIANAKANAEKNLQNARALFESHLQSVFSRRGNGWVEKRLGDVVTRLTNGYVGPTRNIYLDSGVPYLLARHVKNNRLSFDGKTFVSDLFNLKNKKSMLKTGDVLLVQSGHIGHSAVVTKEHEGHNCHAMIVMTPVGDILTGPFLSLYFNTSEMRERFEEIRSGSTVPHLTCGAVKELSIALPDVATQKRLVDHSGQIETETRRLEGIYRQTLAALDDLKRSLLHQAFTGEIKGDHERD